jgi:acyl-CoA thioesterase I
MDICIFGDSITKGYYDEEKHGWVARLGLKLPGYKIHNFGISGDTTEEVLQRFDANVSKKDPWLFIFSIGVNDSIYIPEEDRNFVGLERFKENIKKLIEKARRISGRIIFVGLAPVDEGLVTPMPWEPKLHYLNKDIKRYDKAIEEICKTENLQFIDINSMMKKIDYKKLLTDGVHPNSQGHEWIAGKVIKELEKINL